MGGIGMLLSLVVPVTGCVVVVIIEFRHPKYVKIKPSDRGMIANVIFKGRSLACKIFQKIAVVVNKQAQSPRYFCCCLVIGIVNIPVFQMCGYYNTGQQSFPI
ncbi:MAG: hypothetical protein A3C55_06010 [Gammaproteobacteria bacterium RIFCSPHIGHO2_02_FULL_42_13]|nr:MAG: hypothetical protein A3C55_06010 [Gammaproteobacteria bacterium RIFCSPHIGHO2_02_FULL_42_13]